MFITTPTLDINKNSYLQQLLVSSCLLSFFVTLPCQAQITPDNSLGNENSVVTPQDTITNLIEGGLVRDNNLFHSFSEFSVNDGARVDFANPDGITNILTRVTGNSISEIFGTLGVDGGANLFLLNPNGIIFGENASLDVSGSFLATTADSYIFENGFAYSASSPEIPALLTVNIPIGLQFGSQAEAIVNQSFYTNEFDEFVGLEVAPGQNLTFVGGDILFEGGIVTAPNGTIEIGSVATNSLVNLRQTANNWTLGYSEVENFQNVSLTEIASINSSGDGAGNIQIQANQLNVLDGSTIFANNLGAQNGGSLTINAQEFQVLGTDNEGNGSLITADVYDVGEGGNFTINTEKLFIKDGGQIAAGTFGIGNSGNLTINATQVEVKGTSPDGEYPSGIFTDVADPEATGNGGNLTITAQELNLSDGAQIAAGTFGIGNGGNLNITAQELKVLNGAKISADTDNSGNSGNLLINVEQLKIGDGISQITTSTWGSGNAGNLIIQASESIEISGTGLDEDLAQDGAEDVFSSGLFASVEPTSTGNGGNLIIETGDLSISDGGRIAVNTLGEGDAGDIFIHANDIEVQDTVVDITDTRSGINSTVEPQGIGDGGNVEIITNNLSLIDGGSIAADALGQGNAGNINIQAQNIDISGVSSDETVLGIEQESLPSSLSTFSTGDFKAGSININTNSLDIDNQAEISVSNLGQGDSGNLNITAQDLSISSSGALRAEVNGGEQGNINLTTTNILLNTGNISAEATGVSTGGNITINSSETLTVLENSRILANAIQGNGGNIDITTQGYFVSSDSLVSASSQFELDGNINIDNLNGNHFLELNPLPNNFVDRTKEIIASCGVGSNKFATTGQGGLPENPGEYLRGKALWQDLRLPNLNVKTISHKSRLIPQTTLIEAQNWQVNQEGNIELVVDSKTSDLLLFSLNNDKCLQNITN